MFQHPADSFRTDHEVSHSLADVLSAFSYALDLTEGQPAGHSVRACLIAMRVAQALGVSRAERNDLYYAVLLKDLGCSSNAARVAEIFLSSDLHMKSNFKRIGQTEEEFIAFIAAETGKDAPEDARAHAMQQIVECGAQLLGGLVETRCHRGADIARQLRFSDATAQAIFSLDEHWDGGGLPLGLAGEEIPLGARLALLAQVADVFHVMGGARMAREEVAARRGTWLDPRLCDAFLALSRNDKFWTSLAEGEAEAQLRRLEPETHLVAVDEAYLDDITDAFGQVIDAKSPFTGGHSARVGRYTLGVAHELGMDADRIRRLRRAAVLHDVGKLGVSSRLLEKPGKLDDHEWVEMRAHAGLTGEILGRIGVMRDLAMIAAAHHERLDGKGYPLSLDQSTIALESRIIAVADIYDALTADRPYRAAMPVERALAIIDGDTGSALDPACAAALKAVIAREPLQKAA
jgi:HD-GYP domain-containing protein (c-di-GMP phosphodiesterase class II)